MASTIDSASRFAGGSQPRSGHRAARPPSGARRWLAAAGLGLGAFALSVLLREYIGGTLFVFFFAAIALTAWYSGLRASLAVTALGLVTVDYFLLTPPGQLSFGRDVLVMLIALAATATFISWLTDSLFQARAAAAGHAELLAEQAVELEAQMEAAQRLAAQLERANTELSLTAERAQAASRAKTEFLAVMSHELRTPLNAIVGYADLMQTEVSGPLSEAQRTQLQRIRSSAFHLLDLIQDVLSFTRIEGGREKLQLREVDLGRLVRETAAYVTRQSGDKPLAQKIELPAEPLTLVTDEEKLRHILVNLLGNACKFTEYGSVGIHVERQGDDAVFLITDTGPGIAAENQELIFEPFRQVDQSLTRRKDGAGLGLPVSRRLAHLLGGDLQLRSVVGQGTTFTLRVPVRSREN